jgi:hypothetical protein
MGLPLRVSSASPHNETPRIYSLQTAAAAPPIQRRPIDGAPFGSYHHRAGILTGFPNFGHSELPQALGSPNPQLTNVAEESLLYSGSGILILILLLLTP